MRLWVAIGAFGLFRQRPLSPHNFYTIFHQFTSPFDDVSIHNDSFNTTLYDQRLWISRQAAFIRLISNCDQYCSDLKALGPILAETLLA